MLLTHPTSVDERNDISSTFWPEATPFRSYEPTGRRDLFDLFVEEIGDLISGASHACESGQTLCQSLPPNQITLRQLASGLTHASRACLTSLPEIIRDEGLLLHPPRETAVHGFAPAETLLPNAKADNWEVVGSRVVSMFYKTALCLKAQTDDAAENAFLLGSERLQAALQNWADVWNGYLTELDFRKSEFRVRAYAAGLSIPTFKPFRDKMHAAHPAKTLDGSLS